MIQKTLFILILAINCFMHFGQEKQNAVGLSFSNNGQLSDVMDDFYFYASGDFAPANDVFSYKESAIKYNFHYEYQKNSFLFGINLGYGFRKDSYDISNQTEMPKGDKSQSYKSISLSCKHLWNIEKLQIETGFAIPFYFISDYKENYNTSSEQLSFSTITDGGRVFGLNSVTSIKWFFYDNLFLSTNLSFGLLFFNLGGETSYVDKDPTTDDYTFENTYTKTSVSKAEFSFGFGLQF